MFLIKKIKFIFKRIRFIIYKIFKTHLQDINEKLNTFIISYFIIKFK